jgi:rhomboid protease GluP
MLGIKYNTLIDAGQYWRLLTPMLLHGSFLHIGFNMYAVYLLGRLLERFYGHWKFLLLYVLGGFTGALASYLLTPNPSLGASTSTFGLLAAYGILAYRNKLIFGSRAKLMLRNAIQVGVLNLIIGLSGGIDNWAHLGGALGGIALAWFAGPVFELTGSTMETMRVKNKITDRLFVSVFLGLFLLAGVIAIVLPGAV